MNTHRPLLFLSLTCLLAACSPAGGDGGASSSSGSSLSSLSTMSSSAIAVTGEGTKIDPTDANNFALSTPESYNYPEPTDPYLRYGLYDQNSIDFTGTNTPTFEKLVVIYTPGYGDERDRDVYQVKNFEPGDTDWKYTASVSAGNLQRGVNEYRFRMYLTGGEKYVEKVFLLQYYANRTEETLPARPALNVQWSTPQELPAISYLKSIDEYDRTVQYVQKNAIYSNSVSGPSEVDNYITLGMQYFKVGTVKGGDYDGGDVIVAIVDNCIASFDMCFSTSEPEDIVRTKDGRFIRFTPNTNILFKTQLDSAHTIEAIPQTPLVIPNVTNATLKHVKNASQMFSSAGTQFFVSKELGQPVYQGDNGCLAVKGLDGTQAIYDIELKDYFSQPNVLEVTLNNGQTMSHAYASHVTKGCNMSTFCYDLSTIDDSALEKIGKLKNGQAVYREKHTPEQLAKFKENIGVTDLATVYTSLPNWEGAPPIPTPQAFYDNYPVIYVKDPLGRMLRFQQEQYQSGAECGKPVIYLYPETEQDVNVQVKPVGGLTVSEPAYGNGWNVRATPQSVLTNLSDGKQYGYLFWEGDGGEYTKPTKGFVVARENVHAVMLEKLHTLGLNAIETADFLAFWEPKLTASPWTFITFVPQSQFETMAPLTVTPTPDTVIRVFMDFTSLEGPIDVEPLILTTPERKGFTVVEWGGVLHSTDAKGDEITQCSIR